MLDDLWEALEMCKKEKALFPGLHQGAMGLRADAYARVWIAQSRNK